MVKTRELTDFECRKVIGFYEAGNSKKVISRKQNMVKLSFII
jgi:hypothetical protein